ncbi:MAG: response regulator [Actinomycetota bacterium]
MAINLNDLWTEVLEVSMAISQGNLTRKVSGERSGEFLEVKNVVNSMLDQLSDISAEVTRTMRELGMDGKLDVHLKVSGVEGVWSQLVENINILVAGQTSMVRDLGEVAARAINGDFTRFVNVRIGGEVGKVLENINQMVRTLAETTMNSQNQDWLKTNLAEILLDLQSHRNIEDLSRKVLADIEDLVDAHYSALHFVQTDSSGRKISRVFRSHESLESEETLRGSKLDQNLIEECIQSGEVISIDDYEGRDRIAGAQLGQAHSINLLLKPIHSQDSVIAILELRSFTVFTPTQRSLIFQSTNAIGVTLNNIELNLQREALFVKTNALAEALTLQQEELKKANLGLEEKAMQLAQSSRFKSEFLSNMSHELRTPLNSLLILAELLSTNSSNHLDSKEVHYAKLIQESGNDLLSLINEILDLAKIESGTITLNYFPLPFSSVKRQIENLFGHLAQEKHINFEVIIDESIPDGMIVDEMRLLQILKNLIANAIKFSENEEVTVRMERAEYGWNHGIQGLDKSGDVIAFSIEDTGIGIPPEKQSIIFEAFQQADGKSSRKFGGTGLGLSISRELAQLLGGELVLTRSEEGKGSIFTLYLPREPIRQNGFSNSELEKVEEEEQSNLNGTKVLIVDDEPRNVIALSAILESENLDVLTASSGAAAIEVLSSTSGIDIVLMDIMMPDMDGYETVKKIRTLPNFANLPIIAVTANAMIGDREKCLAAGASEYLSKPIDIKKLRAMMKDLIS